MTKKLERIERPAAIRPHNGVSQAEARAKGAAPFKTFARIDGGDDDGVFIYGDIGGWGVWADDVIPELQRIDAEGKDVEIRIHSDGGDVFEAQAIAVALKRMKAKTIGVVYGNAASAASIILAACDERRAFSNSLVMVHAPWGWTVGNAQEMRDGGELLDMIREQFGDIYSEATGDKTPRDTIMSWMAYGKDTWFTAAKALESGLLSAVEERPFAAMGSMSKIAAPETAPDEIRTQIEAANAAIAAAAEEEAKAAKAASKEAARAKVAAALGDVEAAAFIKAGKFSDEDADAFISARKAQLAYESDVRKACALFDMPDRADDFIKAKTDMEDVKAQLRAAFYAARAQKDADNPISPVATPPAEDTPDPKASAMAKALETQEAARRQLMGMK